MAECAQLGDLLGRMHLVARSYGGYLENPRGPKWWRSAAADVRPFLDAARLALLEAELRFQAGHRFPDLPRAAVHADLFRDNALFQGGRLSGVIDFYFAGVDCLAYDLAVCANDWCLVDPGNDRRLGEARTRALLEAYEAVRPLLDAERRFWPVMLRAAALRFWLSRLHDKHLPHQHIDRHNHAHANSQPHSNTDLHAEPDTVRHFHAYAASHIDLDITSLPRRAQLRQTR